MLIGKVILGLLLSGVLCYIRMSVNVVQWNINWLKVKPVLKEQTYVFHSQKTKKIYPFPEPCLIIHALTEYKSNPKFSCRTCVFTEKTICIFKLEPGE